MSVVVSYFNAESKQMFLDGLRSHLAHKARVNEPAGTIVVLADLTGKNVWGICQLKNWETTASTCREFCPLDTETYTGDYLKYSKYEIGIENLRVLKNPVSFERVRRLVGGETEVHRPCNMWMGFHSSFCKIFGAEEAVLERYRIWASSML
jgi:hypothetical protein